MEIRTHKALFPHKSDTGSANEARQTLSNGHRAGVNMEFALILIPVRFQQHGISLLSFRQPYLLGYPVISSHGRFVMTIFV